MNNLFDYEWAFQPNGTGIVLSYTEANRADVVLQWVRDGLNHCTDIATEMGLSKGQVSKLATRLIGEGKLISKRGGYEVID